MKAGDLEPDVFATLEDGAGNRIDLAGATVEFAMARLHGDLLFVAEAQIDQAGDPTMGDVHYEWTDGDTDIPGGYLAEWRVEFPSGERETFPNHKFRHIAIIPTLGEMAS